MDKTIKLACLLAIIIFSSCASRKDFGTVANIRGLFL